jgi:hypothetical protein
MNDLGTASVEGNMLILGYYRFQRRDKCATRLTFPNQYKNKYQSSIKIS